MIVDNKKSARIKLVSSLILSFVAIILLSLPFSAPAQAQIGNLSPAQLQALLQGQVESVATTQLKNQIQDQLNNLGLTPAQQQLLNLAQIQNLDQLQNFAQNELIQIAQNTEQFQALTQIQQQIQSINPTAIRNNIQNLALTALEEQLQNFEIPPAAQESLNQVQSFIEGTAGLQQLANLDLNQITNLDLNPDNLLALGIDPAQIPNIAEIQNVLTGIENFTNIQDLNILQIQEFDLAGLNNLTQLNPLLNLSALQLDDFFTNLAAGTGAVQVLANLGIDINLLPGLALTACTGSCACQPCGTDITTVHQNIRDHVTQEFIDYRTWIVETYFPNYIQKALALMTEQLVTVGMQQVEIIGTFFDAKHQLETQRLFQQLQAQAHKDYQPSEDLCAIGTAVRSLASSERRSDLTQMTFSNRMMQRQLLSKDVISGRGSVSDRNSRVAQFKQVYCNPTDNSDGLNFLCNTGGGRIDRRNTDVDYTNTVENTLTLDIDFTTPNPNLLTDDEVDIFSLGANLFGNEVLSSITDRLLADENNVPKDLQYFYLRQRSLAAKRSVAQNSYSAITSMRANGNAENTAFLYSFMQELGVALPQIREYLGDNPSYFAQMEILTKKIYQNPKFYADLYDKPVNIERKGAALQALALMQDRDIYDSLIRSEAVLATLLEALILKEHDRVSESLKNTTLDGEHIGDGV